MPAPPWHLRKMGPARTEVMLRSLVLSVPAHAKLTQRLFSAPAGTCSLTPRSALDDAVTKAGM
jgi:hypothetical protein